MFCLSPDGTGGGGEDEDAGLGGQKEDGGFSGRSVEGRRRGGVGEWRPPREVLRGRSSGRQGRSSGERAGLDPRVKQLLSWECQMGSWRGETLRGGGGGKGPCVERRTWQPESQEMEKELSGKEGKGQDFSCISRSMHSTT